MEDSNGLEPEFPKLSGRVPYFKETEEGESSMSDLVEQYAQEVAAKAVEKAVEKTARESTLEALMSSVRNAMERGGMALGAAMDLLGVPESMAADVRLALGA
jgi:hypothetical protein